MSDCCNEFEFTSQQGTFYMDGGIRGKDGVTFYPHVSAAGILSWTNDGGKQNPDPVNIKGADGKSAYAAAQEAGFTGTEQEFNAYLSGIGELTEDVNDLKSAFNADLVFTDWAPNITQGSYFRTSNGAAASSSSNKYARTSALWNGYGTRKAIVMDDPVYEFCLTLYDATGTTSGTGYIGYEGYATGMLYIPKNAKLFGISFRRVDQTALTDSDITAISAALSALAATDTTLSVAGAPADAKTVGGLKSAVSLEPIALQYTSGGTGYVKHADGAIGTSTLSSHTDYVDISGYPYLYYKRQGSSANNPTAGMAFYDENKTYICGETSVAQQSQSGYMSSLKKIAVPPNAKYARFSTYTDETTYGAFEVYGESPIVDKIKETDDVIIPLLPESLPFGLNSGQYVYSDGVITKKDGYYTTTYIDVTNISKIIYTRITTPENWAGYGMAWFDENKEVIPNTGTGSVQYAQDYSYVLTVKDVPTGAKYIMLTVMDRDGLNLPFGIYDFAEYEKALTPNAKRYAPVVGSPRLYLASTPVDPDFDIRSSSSGGTSYSDIYDRYDALCTAYPHWIKRDTDIGVDSENNPIARYTVRMYDPLVFLGDGVRNPPFTSNVWENNTQYRRALLTAGVHGNERVGVMGLYYLIKDILSSNDEWARYIKSNYILEIIPIINPGGFNANRRRNANNVDINRDYMKKTTVEAQVMTTFIQSIKNDLYCAMDFHGSYELGFLATPQNSHIINKMMTLATQTISACADDWGSIESVIGNTSDYYPYSYGCLSQNSGTLPYYILMNNITPYAFTVESPCLLLDTTVQANSAKVVAAAKMAMDQGCNVLQALLCI